MTDPLLTTLMQFGAAGLIGLLWLHERRHSAVRDRQLEQAHRRLLTREREVNWLLKVLNDNTRAINSLEHSQRRLIRFLSSRYQQRPGKQSP